MATRNGKIANLPNDIREQLNLRLLEGETGRELAAWLNALPEVQSILASQFNGSDISEVNLTAWRQGGYLQWRTERECFDSAHALVNGDSAFAETGLSAERLLNMLTLRYGQLLMRWDLSSDENVSQAQAFDLMAKKARILQGISRSVLAIHRFQSQPARKRSEPSISPATMSAGSEGLAAFEHALNSSSDSGGSILAELFRQTTDAALSAETTSFFQPGAPEPLAASSGSQGAAQSPTLNHRGPHGAEAHTQKARSAHRIEAEGATLPARAPEGQSAIPRILSGPIGPSIIASKLPCASLKTNSTSREIHDAA